MGAGNTVIQFSVQRMSCTGCGAEANASCNCGVAYAPKIVRAAEAIRANPQKSDRAIAAEIGISNVTPAAIAALVRARTTTLQEAADLIQSYADQYAGMQVERAVLHLGERIQASIEAPVRLAS